MHNLPARGWLVSFPYRDMMKPAMIPPIGVAVEGIARRTPAFDAESSSTTWKNSGSMKRYCSPLALQACVQTRGNITAYAARPAQRLASWTDTDNLPGSMRSGTMGIALVFASTNTNRANSTMLPTSDPITHPEYYGSTLPPKPRANSCIESAITRIKAPEKSIFAHIPSSRPSASFCCCWFETASHPSTKPIADIGTWNKKHYRQPIESAINTPNEAPETAPEPYTEFWRALYKPRRLKGIMSELMIVAIVVRPPPPKPLKARIRLRNTTFVASPHPRQPAANVIVDTKKHILLPSISTVKSGWNAVVVNKYEVVCHETVFAESKSELIMADVAAVIVLSSS